MAEKGARPYGGIPYVSRKIDPIFWVLNAESMSVFGILAQSVLRDEISITCPFRKEKKIVNGE
jgi:hypothetical protein